MRRCVCDMAISTNEFQVDESVKKVFLQPSNMVVDIGITVVLCIAWIVVVFLKHGGVVSIYNSMKGFMLFLETMDKAEPGSAIRDISCLGCCVLLARPPAC